MSCPDWQGLAAARRGVSSSDEPKGWQEAVRHLDACSHCRRDALAADPMLIFRRLPRLAEPTSPALSAAGAERPQQLDQVLDWGAEAEAMRGAFNAMRTAGRYEALGTASPRHRGRRWLAAACLAITAASAGGGVGRLAGAAGSGARNPAADLAGAVVVAGTVAAGGPGTAFAPARPALDIRAVHAGQELAAPSAIEGLNLPRARIYQMHNEHLTSIMVVSEKIDV